jgi:hypothetical protein
MIARIVYRMLKFKIDTRSLELMSMNNALGSAKSSICNVKLLVWAWSFHLELNPYQLFLSIRLLGRPVVYEFDQRTEALLMAATAEVFQ